MGLEENMSLQNACTFHLNITLILALSIAVVLLYRFKVTISRSGNFLHIIDPIDFDEPNTTLAIVVIFAPDNEQVKTGLSWSLSSKYHVLEK